jgi:nucleoside-diphosphate-sugar epimerase
MSCFRKKIAIFGATGHIAKGLIYHFYKKKDVYELFLFARSHTKLEKFLFELGITGQISIHGFEDFENYQYDAIINGIGFGSPQKLKESFSEVFFLTEKFDNIILEYLKKNQEVLYINFSSGAVYGQTFQKAAEKDTCNSISVNQICPKDYYAIAKLNSETKHRALEHYNIVDLRIFSYFSRFIDLNIRYLVNDMINSIKEKKVFFTTRESIVRDFVHPEDLFFLIENCLSQDKINDVFDVYSLKPVSKLDLLQEFNLKYEIKDDVDIINVTGIKNFYYSTNKRAEMLGYRPRYKSIEVIKSEARCFL